MIRALLRVRFLSSANPMAVWQQSTSFSNYRNAKSRSHDQHNSSHKKGDWRQSYRQSHSEAKEEARGRWRGWAIGAGAPLLGLSWVTTMKDVLGWEKVVLDKDPLKDKVKKAMLLRSRNRYTEAIDVLHDALKEAQDSKVETYITRIYDEIANTYYEMNDLEKAYDLFREVIERLIRLHAKHESSPEFIGISLKMADIFARRGDLQNAEVGYKHCVSKQLQVLEEHQKKYLVAKGAYMQDRTPVETFGATYSDPIILFAMALEAYAYFLLEYCGSDRLTEAEEFMDEVLKISYQVYGSYSPHSVNVINNFAAKCIMKNQHKLARKYLEVALYRVLNLNDCEPIIVSYYCNYAEALFHTGDEARAVEFARKAELFSRSQEPRVQKYAQRFRREMERDARRNGVRVKKSSNNEGEDGGKGGGGWRSWIPI